jgi:methionine-gamma-lyase
MYDPKQSIRDVQHFGEQGGVVPVIDMGSTSTFLDPQDMERTFTGELAGCYLYSRHSNPTVDMFSQKLAAMEGLEAAVGVSSGMAAINCTLRQIMPQGGHIVASKTIYGGTYALMQNILPQSGITVSFVDTNDLKAVESAITSKTKIIYAETMSNPMLRIADLAALKSICTKKNLKLVVDNTFTPLIVRPAQFGADVVVYSCTKYISGASDMIAGAVVSSREFINQLIDINFGMIMLTGPAMDPRIAHELYLRLDHLPLRMLGHSKAASYFANRIAEEKIPLAYPGLKSHPDYDLLTKMMNPEFGYGGMVVLDCGTVERASKLAKKLQDVKFGLYAVSLGFSRTLISCPAVSTSSEIPVTEQVSMGLSTGLLRLSIGFTGNDQVMVERFLKCYREL